MVTECAGQAIESGQEGIAFLIEAEEPFGHLGREHAPH